MQPKEEERGTKRMEIITRKWCNNGWVLTTEGIGLAKYLVPWRVPPSAHHAASERVAQMKGTSVQPGRM